MVYIFSSADQIYIYTYKQNNSASTSVVLRLSFASISGLKGPLLGERSFVRWVCLNFLLSFSCAAFVRNRTKWPGQVRNSDILLTLHILHIQHILLILHILHNLHILHILHILQKHPSQQGPIQSIFNKVVTSSVNKFVSQSVSESVSELLTWVDYDRTWVR